MHVGPSAHASMHGKAIQDCSSMARQEESQECHIDPIFLTPPPWPMGGFILGWVGALHSKWLPRGLLVAIGFSCPCHCLSNAPPHGGVQHGRAATSFAFCSTPALRVFFNCGHFSNCCQLWPVNPQLHNPNSKMQSRGVVVSITGGWAHMVVAAMGQVASLNSRPNLVNFALGPVGQVAFRQSLPTLAI